MGCCYIDEDDLIEDWNYDAPPLQEKWDYLEAEAERLRDAAANGDFED